MPEEEKVPEGPSEEPKPEDSEPEGAEAGGEQAPEPKPDAPKPEEPAAAEAAPAPPAAAEDEGAWPPAGEVTKDEKTMALVSWLLVIVSTFVGPLIIYLIKKDESKFVAFHAMQGIIVGVAVLVLNFACGVGVVLALVVGIIYALKANKGEWAELPLVGEWARKGL